MDLRSAVELVWADVADSDCPDVTIHEAIRYARVDVDLDELQVILNAQRVGMYSGDVYGAYVDVRHASEPDVDAVIASLV